jgi:hypothetical protein
MIFPQNSQKVQVAGTTVDFYKYEENGIVYYQFDTSKSGPPEPMVNAMSGLKLVTSPNIKLVMINHKKPMGLLQKIGENYNVEVENLDNGNVKLIFSYIGGKSEEANLEDKNCHG